MKNISELLLRRGTSFYKFGRIAIKFFLTIGAGLLAFIMMFADGYQLAYLAISGYYEFVNFLMVLAYLGILVGMIGMFLYFWGLHYLGLGQISKNTETPAVKNDELPEL